MFKSLSLHNKLSCIVMFTQQMFEVSNRSDKISVIEKYGPILVL